MTLLKLRKKKKEIVYQNQYSYVDSQEVDFGSFTKKYFVSHFGQKAGLLVVRGGSILMVRQYRLLVDRLSWEIPGGKVDEKETPEASAIRECFEETGIRCRNVKPLLDYQQSLEVLDLRTHLFYTNDFDDDNQFRPNCKEVEAIQWMPLERCLEMIKEKTLCDSFSILAILAYNTFVL